MRHEVAWERITASGMTPLEASKLLYELAYSRVTEVEMPPEVWEGFRRARG